MIYHTAFEINYPLDGHSDDTIFEMLGHEYFLVVTNKPSMNNKQGWVCAYAVPCNTTTKGALK